MKRKIFLNLILLLVLFLSSCKSEFELEKAEEKVLEEGYTLLSKSTTEEELEKQETDIIKSMKIFDNYTVDELNLTYFSSYEKGVYTDADYKLIYFMVFESKEYADLYCNWSYNYRVEGSLWRVAQQDNIIVDTSDENLHKKIGLTFN